MYIFTPNTLIKSSEVNANFAESVDVTKQINPYKFHAQRTGALTLTALAFTVFPFNSEVYDTNNDFDSSTNYRYTAPVAGYYLFSARVNSEFGYTRQIIALTKNGTQVARGIDFSTATGTIYVQPTVTAILYLAVGDNVDCRYYVNAAQAWTSGDSTTYFMGHLLSV